MKAMTSESLESFCSALQLFFQLMYQFQPCGSWNWLN